MSKDRLDLHPMDIVANGSSLHEWGRPFHIVIHYESIGPPYTNQGVYTCRFRADGRILSPKWKRRGRAKEVIGTWRLDLQSRAARREGESRAGIKPYKLFRPALLWGLYQQVLEHQASFVTPRMRAAESAVEACFDEDGGKIIIPREGAVWYETVSVAPMVSNASQDESRIRTGTCQESDLGRTPLERLAASKGFEHQEVGRQYLLTQQWWSKWWQKVTIVRNTLLASVIAQLPEIVYRHPTYSDKPQVAIVKFGTAKLYLSSSTSGVASWALLGIEDPKSNFRDNLVVTNLDLTGGNP